MLIYDNLLKLLAMCFSSGFSNFLGIILGGFKRISEKKDNLLKPNHMPSQNRSDIFLSPNIRSTLCKRNYCFSLSTSCILHSAKI